MDPLLKYIIPIAFGAAVSPTLLAMTLAILSNPKAGKSAIWLFLIGSLLVIIIIGTLGLILTGLTIPRADEPSKNLSASLDIFFGIVLAILGIRRLFQKDNQKPSINNSSKSSHFFILGLILMATNLSTLVLYFAILKDLGLSQIEVTSKIPILAIVIFIIMLPVSIPLALDLLFPASFQKILTPINTFLQKNSKYVSVAILFLFATLLIIKGKSAIS